MRYVVASLDVLGTRDFGYEVNDEHQIGTIDVSQEVADDDKLLLGVLNTNGFLDNATIDDVYFMGESCDYLQVFSEETDRPLLSLSLRE